MTAEPSFTHWPVPVGRVATRGSLTYVHTPGPGGFSAEEFQQIPDARVDLVDGVVIVRPELTPAQRQVVGGLYDELRDRCPQGLVVADGWLGRPLTHTHSRDAELTSRVAALFGGWLSRLSRPPADPPARRPEQVHVQVSGDRGVGVPHPLGDEGQVDSFGELGRGTRGAGGRAAGGGRAGTARSRPRRRPAAVRPGVAVRGFPRIPAAPVTVTSPTGSRSWYRVHVSRTGGEVTVPPARARRSGGHGAGRRRAASAPRCRAHSRRRTANRPGPPGGVDRRDPLCGQWLPL